MQKNAENLIFTALYAELQKITPKLLQCAKN